MCPQPVSSSRHAQTAEQVVEQKEYPGCPRCSWAEYTRPQGKEVQHQHDDHIMPDNRHQQTKWALQCALFTYKCGLADIHTHFIVWFTLHALGMSKSLSLGMSWTVH